MGAYDIIEKKRDGKELTKEEIQYMVMGFMKGEIPDYQMSAFLMAVFLNGMSEQETMYLTKIMAVSGKQADLNRIEGIKVDKHSTGGVGDTTTLVVAPVAAACGVPVAKMSGRGLGHTGGTIDKLESIPGFCTSMEIEEFIRQVNEIGIAVTGQTTDLAPADKKIYALRDVTATVDSIPLIASSIMSKKLAAGADAIVLDVKTGNGAFMKEMKAARKLAAEMVKIGNQAGKKTIALITDMNEPLGDMVGNALEVIEAIEILKGKRKGKLYEVSVELASYMLLLSDKAETYEEAKIKVGQMIENGQGLKKMEEFIRFQKGDVSVISDYSRFPKAEIQMNVISERYGYVHRIDCEEIGKTSILLGGGRITKDSKIDLSVGIEIKKRIGDRVEQGEVLAVIYANQEEKGREACKKIRDAYTITDEKTMRVTPVICKII